MVEVDGWLEPGQIDECLVSELESLEPYGRGYPEAKFLSTFQVARVRRIGKTGEHVSLTLRGGTKHYQAVWFFVDEAALPRVGTTYTVVYAPRWNYWKGQKKLQLMVAGMQSH